MSNEIELKLLVGESAAKDLEQAFFPQLQAKLHSEQNQLFNHYYDTADASLSAMDIGLRIRGKNGQYEQTIKTAGSSHGGLHQRPEYNVALETNQLDLTLFPAHIWPADTDAESLQQQLELRFTTHFQRNSYLLEFDNGDKLELVFDAGKVEAGEYQSDISEVELELVEGSVERLFELAKQISQITPCRMGLFSKAARGNQLLKGDELLPESGLSYLPVDEQDSIQSWFIRSLEYGLRYWQYHEQSYVQNQKLNALKGIKDSIELLQQVMQLFQTVCQDPQVIELSHKLNEMQQQWLWLDEVLAFKTLCSKKGYYHKKLDKYPELHSFLRGRIEGSLLQQQPHALIHQGAKLQLELCHMLQLGEWRQQSAVTQALNAQVGDWLEHTWKQVKQGLCQTESQGVEFWLQQQVLLRDTLLRGILLANSYGQEVTQTFRTPWLNMLDGIEELQLLTTLSREATQAEEAYSDTVSQWCQQKIDNLLPLLAESRLQALAIVPYWH